MGEVEAIAELRAQGYTFGEAVRIRKKEGRKVRRKLLAERRKEQNPMMDALNRWMHSYLSEMEK
jgi:uncharacterized protein YoaH (UPF0181 family)